MSAGRKLRQRRFFTRGRSVIITMDHPQVWGPLSGIEDAVALARLIAESDADGIMVSTYLIENVADVVGAKPLVARLDGSATDRGDITRTDMVTTPEYALACGAAMGVVNAYVGADNESDLLNKVGMTAVECREVGLPLMAEMLPASALGFHFLGESVQAMKDKVNTRKTLDLDGIRHAARVGAELGADLIKTHFPGTVDGMKSIAESAVVPVLIAGGPKTQGYAEFFSMISKALDGGAAGVTMGRSVWQDPSPRGVIAGLCHLAHEGGSVDEAVRLVQA